MSVVWRAAREIRGFGGHLPDSSQSDYGCFLTAIQLCCSKSSSPLPCAMCLCALAVPRTVRAGAWDYQVCTEFLGQEQPYFPASASSMFWDQGPFNWDDIVQHCRATWGVEPSQTWIVEQHGGLDWR